MTKSNDGPKVVFMMSSSSKSAQKKPAKASSWSLGKAKAQTKAKTASKPASSIKSRIAALVGKIPSRPKGTKQPKSKAKRANIGAVRKWLFASEAKTAPTSKRVGLLLVTMAVVLSFEAAQAVNIQTLQSGQLLDEYYSRENSSAVKRITLTALRGSISDRFGEVLAYDEETFTIVADPEMIKSNGVEDDTHRPNMSGMSENDIAAAQTLPARLANLLQAHIGGDAAVYLNAIVNPSSSRYSILARNVPKYAYRQFYDDYTKINSQYVKATAAKKKGDPAYADFNPRERLLGITAEKAVVRRYAGGTLAANLLGFIKTDPKTGEPEGTGLEYSLRNTLIGKDGYEEYEGTDSKRIPLGQAASVQPVNGQDYTLTIDAGLQSEVEQILADRVTESRAKSGTALVMDVNTGEILSMASFPTFDPNDWANARPEDKEKRAKVSPEAFTNRAVTFAYTPGSVQKTLTFAALLDAGLVKANDVVEIPDGIKSGSHIIHDSWSHGTLTYYARGVVAKSSNIGTILLARKMNKNKLLEYYRSFGLGQKTGLGLPGESAGKLPEKGMPGYSRDGMSYGGSELIVTAVQEAAAVAAITNGGTYHQPRILDSTRLPDGTVQAFETGESRQVISSSASKEVMKMMEAMAVNSSAHTFDVPGYRVGAKTGTAKEYDFDCSCWNGLTVSTIGVAPVEKPQYLVYVVVQNPQAGKSGASVAGPAEQDIMSLVLPRYGVAPSTSKTPKYPIEPAAPKTKTK